MLPPPLAFEEKLYQPTSIGPFGDSITPFESNPRTTVLASIFSRGMTIRELRCGGGASGTWATDVLFVTSFGVSSTIPLASEMDAPVSESGPCLVPDEPGTNINPAI